MIAESLVGILTAFFLIATPIEAVAGFVKRGPKQQVKTEHKVEKLTQTAEEHWQKAEKKAVRIDKAEEKEKKDLVEAQSFIDKLKYFVNAEKNFEEGVERFVLGLKEEKNVDFPRKQELISTLREESVLAKEILQEISEASGLSKRVRSADKDEMKTVRKDLHKALVAEKEGKFEHALSKEEIDFFKHEYHNLAKNESDIQKEGNFERKISVLLWQTGKKLKSLIVVNSESIKILKKGFKTKSEILSADKQEEMLASKKRKRIEEIVVNLHFVSKYLEHLRG